MRAQRLVCSMGVWVGITLLANPQNIWAQAAPVFEPGESIRIATPRLPSPLPAGHTIQLDGVDVTAWLVREDEQSLFELPIALSPGPYLLEWFDPEAVTPRASWSFTVRASTTSRLSWGVDVGVEASHRFIDRALPPGPPERLQWRGSGVVDAYWGPPDTVPGSVVSQEALQLGVRIPFLYDRVNGLPPDGRSLEMGDFLAEANRGPIRARLGHFLPAESSLILEGFQRRGIGTELSLEPLRSRLGMFVVRTEPISGFREGFGVRDHRHRVSGVSFDTRLLEHERHGVVLRGTYLGGQGSANGAALGSAFEADVVDGRAWSVVLDANLFDQRARLRVEHARTRSQLDAPGSEQQQDGATSVFLRLAPFPDAALAGKPLTSAWTLEWREVGPEFQSLANLLAPIDRELGAGTWNLGWDIWSARVAYSQERDNVERRAELPRYRTNLFDANLGAQLPFPSFDQPVWRRWLGGGFFDLRYFREHLAPLEGATLAPLAPVALFPNGVIIQPSAGCGAGCIIVIGTPFIGVTPVLGVAGFAAPLDDRLSRTTTLRLGSRYEGWAWATSHTRTLREDLSSRSDDSRTDATSFDLSWQPRRGWDWNGSVQRQRQRFDPSGVGVTTWQGQLATRWTSTEETLAAGLQTTWSHTRDGMSTDVTTIGFSASLDWRLREADGAWPGVVVGLSAQYQDFQDDFRRQGGEAYQVFATALLTWERSSR